MSYDFTQATVRCSQIYRIMGGADRKTNLQIWEEMCEELVRQQLRQEKMKKKDGPGYAKIIETIDRLKNLLLAFESVKNEELPLPDGAKSYMSSLYADLKYGKWNPVKDIGNKYTTKGKEAEEESITLVSRLDKTLYHKNELALENHFLRGTPDIIVGEDPYNAEKVVDVKSPWDCETFFANLNKDLVPQYEYQMHGYLALTNAPIAEVNFCLVDIPDYMWLNEQRRLFDRMEVVTEESPEYKKAAEQLYKNLTFGDMPIEERRIKFTVMRDDEIIEKIYAQVKKCRPYLQEIEKMHILGRDAVILEKSTQPEQIEEDNT